MTSLTIFALWAVNLLFDTAGQLAFKAAASENKAATNLEHWRFMLSRPWLWLGVACFVLEFVAWLAFLSVVPLAQGVLLGMMGIVTIMLGGRIWFHEHFTRVRIVGVSLIVVGVALVGVGGMNLRRFYLIGFVVLIVFDVFSQVCFKYAALHADPFALDAAWLMRVVTEPWMYGSIVGYLGAFVTWMTLLRHAPIGPAFAVSHLEVIGVMIISVPLFNEHLSALQLLGAGIIVAGVLCLAYSEPEEAKD